MESKIRKENRSHTKQLRFAEHIKHMFKAESAHNNSFLEFLPSFYASNKIDNRNIK